MQMPDFAHWTMPQWQAAGKHVLSYAAGATTAAVALHLLSPTDAAGISENLNTIWEGIMTVAKGVAGLAAIIVPIYTSLRAAHNASPTEQVKHVAAMANDPASPVKAVITEATPEGVKLANAIPGPVVPAGTEQAERLAKTS